MSDHGRCDPFFSSRVSLVVVCLLTPAALSLVHFFLWVFVSFLLAGAELSHLAWMVGERCGGAERCGLGVAGHSVFFLDGPRMALGPAGRDGLYLQSGGDE